MKDDRANTWDMEATDADTSTKGGRRHLSVTSDKGTRRLTLNPLTP